MLNNDSGYIKKELPAKVGTIGLVFLAAGIVFGTLGFITDPQRAAMSYLPAFMFLVSIGIGSLFLVAIEYLAGADWSVPFRRIAEFLSSLLPLLIILVIPLLLNMKNLFSWTHIELVSNDPILQGKAPFLNSVFFITRVFVILLIWTAFYLKFIMNSRKQDVTGDQALTKNSIVFSGIFMPVFAFTITLTAVDWLMSLEPRWFSTIFGVYFFSGAVWSSLAAVTFIAIKLKENGYLHPKVNSDHYYSLGTLLFAFTVFWAYIAFCQYMLIWYADLPEETFWFMHRWTGGWSFLSLAVIVTHFIVPFGALLSFPSKTNPARLKFIAIWILVAHYIDLYWLIMPSFYGEGRVYTFSWLDIVFPIGAAGLIIVVFNRGVKLHNLIPLRDPKLQKGLDFRL
ncbi:MAG: quinol:cytochrome C oxidoreductase [Ignavibacteriaceae bacterium]|nr:quinol:cytochrome C oxidoreductase [Ignavibacteriaceae bacterium]